jgi:20S proteasome subunit alpha 7
VPHIQTIADRLGAYAQAYTLYSSVRPFGVSSLVGGCDNSGPQLFVVEPSGVFYVRPISRRETLFQLLGYIVGVPRCCCWQGPNDREDRARETQPRRAQHSRGCPRGRSDVCFAISNVLHPTQLCIHSIYLVHEDSKEKDFELEVSWVGAETNGLFKPVPHDLWEEAVAKGRASVEDFE